VELITCAATHAYLPLWQQQPNLVNAQLTVAKHSHQKLTGRAPVGIWLPECGYYPGLENHLRDLGIGYFFVDTHACEHASEPARYAHYAPLRCPNGVVALPRDPGCSQQVWSADSGYPGDGDYRDFYRDIGVELERALLGDFLAPQHPPIPTGLKYYAITDKHSPAALKRWYDPARAQHKALLHAEDFYQSCCRRVREQSQHMSLPPLLVAPYDAELFGHWWFEGPQWLMQVIRLCHQSEHLTLLSPGDYIARHGKQLQIAVPSTSSWGESGYHQVWLNPRNDFLYPPLLQAGKRLQHLLTTFSPADSLSQRYLTQAIRAFLLAQASDWPFMLKNGAGADYAQQRFQTQLGRFHYLCECLENNNVDDLSTLESLEAQENLFPQLDYQVFA
jgi:1,4-alpha-glucan branching enzyme